MAPHLSLVGRKVGPYQVTALMGRGGMGEVYRARDTRLARDVALKILPAGALADPERRVRFQREARLLAALNHPSIGAIYGWEETGDVDAIVLELVEGPTLADRLRSLPFSMAEALTIGVELAKALEAAHERGIVHRDLKPENIKFTAEGQPKVLDFGIAKALLAPTDDESIEPTQTSNRTVPGAVVGTPAYMSPEQTRGHAVDARADIWAFGCVLYEILAGRRAFGQQTTSDLFAAILTSDPDWTALPAHTPPAVARLLRRCLDKDPRNRLHHAADVRIALEDIRAEWPSQTAASPIAPAVTPRRSVRTSLVILAVVAAAAAGAVVSMWWRRSETALPAVTRFTVPIAPGETLVPVAAISEDGQRIVVVVTQAGTRRLYLRALDGLQSVPVKGSEDATAPFFSPDGRWVAFFAGGKLKKAPVDGGPPVVICDAAGQRGGTWLADNTIVFAPRPAGELFRVSADGGTPERVTTLAEGEASHRWPDAFPDGRTIAYAAGPVATQTSWNEARVVVQSLVTGERHVVVPRGTWPRYLDDQHLLYVQSNGLFALPFDARRPAAAGPVRKVGEVVFQGGAGSAAVDVARNGSLVMVPSAEAIENTLVWVDRAGRIESTGLTIARTAQPRFSPDGSRLAFTVSEPATDVRVYDIERRTILKLTTSGTNLWPVWSPDGKRIAFLSTRNTDGGALLKSADGEGPEELLAPASMPMSWSPDDTFVGIVSVDATTGYDIWLQPVAGGAPRPFVKTPAFEHEIAFAPKGKWAAYVSNESGRNEVYVRPYPDPGTRLQISADGGNEPVWSRDGAELFYRSGDDVMVVDVRTDAAAFTAGKPRRLFTRRLTVAGDRPNYDVAPDGKRFIFIKPVSDVEPPPAQMTVVLNWIGTIQRNQR